MAAVFGIVRSGPWLHAVEVQAVAARLRHLARLHLDDVLALEGRHRDDAKHGDAEPGVGKGGAEGRTRQAGKPAPGKTAKRPCRCLGAIPEIGDGAEDQEQPGGEAEH